MLLRREAKTPTLGAVGDGIKSSHALNGIFTKLLNAECHISTVFNTNDGTRS